jgi:uncharacterized membrane protein (UPF0127 family)
VQHVVHPGTRKVSRRSLPERRLDGFEAMVADDATLDVIPSSAIMKRRRYCVYNQTQECFLSLGVMAADTVFWRLKGLIGKLRLKPDEGMWVVPSHGIHTVGVLFPVDLIYLDKDQKVIHVVEHFPRFRFAPIRKRADSVLELPTHTIFSTQTRPGDQFVICVAEDMVDHLKQGVPSSGESMTV